MTQTQGIDVSAFDGYIDWQAVKDSGVGFAVIRCGYGQDTAAQDDVKFERNVAGCEAAGLPWGTYLYSYATDSAGAASEVQHVLRLLEGKRPLYPVFIDMEDADGYKAKHGVTYQTMKDICVTFCEGVKAAGGLPGVYASKDWLTNKIRDERLDAFELWLAQWNDQPTYAGRFDLWQYTSSGSVGGIDGRVDRNIAYKDYPSIIRAGGCNDWSGAAARAEADTPPAQGVRRGARVRYAGRLCADSCGGGAGKAVDGEFTVSRVIPGRPKGVLLDDLGWAAEADCRPV